MVNNKKYKSSDVLTRTYFGILLFIFGGIVLHAPITVCLSTLWPQYELLFKSWKEILMLLAGVIALYLLYVNKKMQILRDPIIFVIGGYGVLHLVMMGYNFTGVSSSLAGLAIDLRYVLYFGLVYIAMRLYPEYRQMFIKVGAVGALIVFIFAILQVFVLPYDILKYLGYSKDTIIPYLVVDQNYNFIRINSTLRGPNPLGAYASIILSLVVVFIAKRKLKKDARSYLLASTLSIGGLVALWASYSRSALVGLIISAVIIVSVIHFRRISTKIWLGLGVLVIVVLGGIYALRNTDFVANVLLHDNPNSVVSVKSNDGHINSLQDGLKQMVNQPLGAGVGSTGSASLYSAKPEIIENQYLFTAHEVGWFGLILFIYIFSLVMFNLWKLRQDWLALGVVVGGISLALVGLLLPVWVDDTVSIVWWGSAAVVIGSKWHIVDSRGKKHGKR